MKTRRSTSAKRGIVIKVKQEVADSAVDEGEIIYDAELKARELEALISRVFENDMLREMIVSKVIIQPGGEKLSKVDIRSIRSVQKSWRRTVSDILRRRREALFKLSLNRENSTEDSEYSRENDGKKLLTLFNEIIAGYRNEEALPTFSLKLESSFFLHNNHQDLSNCLVTNGAQLVSLEVTFPASSSMALLFPPVSFPKLQRISIQFSDQRIQPTNEGAADAPAMINNINTIHFLQMILNHTVELRELHLKHFANSHIIPCGFESIFLPKTITKLLIDNPVTNRTLSTLLRNDLPNLIQLRLMSSTVAYDTETIYEILDKFRSHLKVLNLRGGFHYSSNGIPPGPRFATLVRFPLMEALETVTVTSHFWQLEGQDEMEIINNRIEWNRNLPGLKELRLLNQSGATLGKWTTTHAASSSVERLFVSIVQPINNMFGIDMPRSVVLEEMQGIHLTFPNLTCLEITLCGQQINALKYLFLEMHRLKKLAISVKTRTEMPHAINWDAVLIGAPAEVVNSLRNHRGFWDGMTLKDDCVPSIRNLTELHSLALVESTMKPSPSGVQSGQCENTPIISDIAFHFGLLKMQKLKYLLLSGRFRASQIMSERWKKEKGILIHSMLK